MLTVVFADIVGSTGLFEKLGDANASQLMAQLTGVHYSGTHHEEDQPSHLLVHTEVCHSICGDEFGHPCVRFCPANVYEMVDNGAGGLKLQINASNCVHCKTCDIMDPYGVITWVAVADGLPAEVRLYDRLFLDAQPDAGGKDFIEGLNPNSLKVIQAVVEPSLAVAKADDKFQFERHGYFVADRVDHVQGSKPVFNLAVGLKDSWGK